jgi:hypothetical protein
MEAALRCDVLPPLAAALARSTAEQGRDLSDDSLRAELQERALAAVMRALFRLHAGGSPDGPDGDGATALVTGAIGEGWDVSQLGIRDLDAVYEGLQSLRLAVEGGEMRWLADPGDRKGGGVYYTPEPLVRHLVHRGVVPGFRAHLEGVAALLPRRPREAARRVLRFRVLDAACGSGRFLVAAAGALAGELESFLAEHPLPAVAVDLDGMRDRAGTAAIEDAQLLRRLVVRRCIYGVERSPLGAEIARASLRLAAAVPGMPPLPLDRSVRVGDALVGAARPEELARFAGGEGDEPFHWPLAFPEAFATGGFDAVVGNPPWDKLKVERHEFFGRYLPGLRGLAEEPRRAAIEQLVAERPDVVERLGRELAGAARLRGRVAAAASYDRSRGDADLCKLFCQRYRSLLAPGGRLALVLPRTAFTNRGSEGFRAWLFAQAGVERIDFLVNTGRWAFDMEPRRAIALVVARAAPPADGHAFEVAGLACSREAFARQARRSGVAVRATALGPLLEVPLVASQDAADLLARLRSGERFALGGGRWRCFPVRELDESDHRLWAGATDGAPLWKGQSFDRYDPHGAGERRCPQSAEVLARIEKRRPGSGSELAAVISAAVRARALRDQRGRARVAFRRISRADDSRTLRAALVPPGVLLTDTAPYLVFAGGDDLAPFACLGVMNSLPFDWQARRYVESHLDFFLLEGLHLPRLGDEAYAAVAAAAARLSCVDERFAGAAALARVPVERLEQDERERLRAEIDAQVALAWGLDPPDLETIFAGFSLAAVPEPYRERVRRRVAARTPAADVEVRPAPSCR